MEPIKRTKIVKGAIATGVINAIINAGIQFFLLKDEVPIAVSVDSITNTDHTILGEAVVLAITLAMILTVIGFFTIKENKVTFYPTVFWLTIKHGFFTFGVLTSLAVLWQRFAGTVEVSLPLALLIIGVISGIVSGVVNYLTIITFVRKKYERHV